MNEEYDEIIDELYISECCGEPIQGKLCGEPPNEIGICSRCKEWSGVIRNNEE